MRVLELFKGTGSVTSYCQTRGWEVTSLDWDPKTKPDICCDILDFQPNGRSDPRYDIIWASPDCAIFSQFQHSHIGRKWKDMEELENAREKNKKYIDHLLEIIKILEPTFFFIENPKTSAIWKIPKLAALPSIEVAYCQFGFPYRKKTRICTNAKLEDKPCICTFHRRRCAGNTTEILNRIPQKLLKYLMDFLPSS